MKQLKSVILIALITSAAMIGLQSMTDEAKGEPAHVTLTRNQVLYIGVDNPIDIKVDGANDSHITPRISGGTIAKDTISGRYIVRVSEGQKATIHVTRNHVGYPEDCGTFEFRIKKIQDPVTFIEHVRNDGVILKENLQKITGVFTRMVDCDYDCSFKPQSFSMSVIEEGEWKEYKAIGPELTPEMKAALTKCEEEDKIIFHNVMTKGPAGDVRHVNCVTITVK